MIIQKKTSILFFLGWYIKSTHWSGTRSLLCSRSIITIRTTFRAGQHDFEERRFSKDLSVFYHNSSSEGDALGAPDGFDGPGEQCLRSYTRTFVRHLQACTNKKALLEGKQLHNLIVKKKLDQDTFLANNLINMYDKCGSVVDACKVFDKMPNRNVVSWTTMIAGYAHHGHYKEALRLFWQIEKEGLTPNAVTFVTVLNACAHSGCLADGRLVHADVIVGGLDSNVLVETALVAMYSKCHSIDDAHHVFSKMRTKNIVTWSVMIEGYGHHGKSKEALKLFWQMQKEPVKANRITFICVLTACIGLEGIAEGKLVHAYIIDSGMESDIKVISALVNMYSKYGNVDKARIIFDNAPKRDVILWNTMIAGYASNGYDKEVLKLFQQMHLQGVKLDKFSFSSILSACASHTGLAGGKNVHAHVVETGLESDIFVENALIDMYANCGSLEDSYRVFNNISEPDVVSWNTMITGFAQHGYSENSLKLYWQMQKKGVNPDKVTIVGALSACANLAMLPEGKLLHAQIIESAKAMDIIVGSALINMYKQCGNMNAARQIFDKISTENVVLWTLMISGYAQHGHDLEALKLFWQMQRESVKPNEITFISALNACTNIRVVAEGKLVHALIVVCRVESVVIVGTALINMYSKCSRMEAAQDMFSKMPKRDVVAWNMIITACIQNGLGKEALELFQQMQQEGIKPDEITFCSIVNACARLADMAQGKQVHLEIIKTGFESNITVGNALIDMYAKCGSIKEAYEAFTKMPKRDAGSWNAMISAYIQHGNDKEALEAFDEMKAEGVPPDEFTFSTVLIACSKLVALAQGKQIHDHVIQTGIEVDICLSNALVDMYAKCGSIYDAYQVFSKMEYRDLVSWNAMIGGCAQHGRPKESFKLFWQMQQEGLKPNEFTFSSILTACSHSGLLDEGHLYFDFMIQEYGIIPTMRQYTCIVDLFCRAGYLEEAEELISKIPLQPNIFLWMSLLGASRNHGNVELAENAAKHVLGMEPERSAAYVLLGNIYASFGRWEDHYE